MYGGLSRELTNVRWFNVVVMACSSVELGRVLRGKKSGVAVLRVARRVVSESRTTDMFKTRASSPVCTPAGGARIYTPI
jgi:hypothetical protein